MSNNKAFKVKNGLDLGEYSKAISDTAVDVFVYDTRKDSDGGAWRKRTQHTSWYNETLNTATRGSRKEFPAVAVIVAENGTITIYDGDDPDLPMWMVFGSASGNIFWVFANTSISMKNATFCVGESGLQGLKTTNFISDSGGYWYSTSGGDGLRLTSNNIADRNSGAGTLSTISTTNSIVNRTVNDVAMTVLPNAPIDAATGLPVPTIAVATDGGLSVIRDDGTVVDALQQSNLVSNLIDFTPDNEIISGTTYELSPYNYSQAARYSVPSADKAQWNNDVTIRYDYNGYGNVYPYPNANSGWQLRALVSNENRDYLGSTELLTLVDLDESDPQNNSLVAYTTSDYATGWMNGDIKLATLSDTDDTDVTGSELVTNGTFDSDISGWSEKETGGTFTASGGQATLTYVTGVASWQTTLSGVTAGKTYTLSFDLISASTSAVQFYYNHGVGGDIGVSMTNTAGTYSATFTAATSTVRVWPRIYQSGNMVIDNISVRLAEEDRSVNGNGLQVFGTVTKNPVATGADLVAYGGFTSSSYLEQPYNSDLDFGTGDFCVMGWFKPSSDVGNYPSIIGRLSIDNTEGTAWTLRVNKPGANYYFFSGGATIFNSTASLVYDKWVCLVAVRRNGILYFYIDGKLDASGTMSNSISNASARTIIGQDATYGTNSSGLALWRISATAPSPEQIAKIYEDEKVLFQENAQATLYGSSDAVTALAYDDTTELLHVGTSAGRSVFQGLRRVDNTTTAVGAAISASNGLVADE